MAGCAHTKENIAREKMNIFFVVNFLQTLYFTSATIESQGQGKLDMGHDYLDDDLYIDCN